MSDKPPYNHALSEWNGPLGLPDFTAFKDEDFAPPSMWRWRKTWRKWKPLPDKQANRPSTIRSKPCN